MKQLIILLLIIIAAIIGYGKYTQYKRYNAPEVNYTTTKKIDKAYYNKDLLYSYYEAIEDLNSYVMMQWTANKIDVRTPEDDDNETVNAVKKYADKLAKINFYEAILSNSLELKEQGLNNTEIKFLENNGITLENYQKRQRFLTIKKLYNSNIKLYNGSENAIIYEVQKELNKRGHNIKIDGVYRIETLNAIKDFETQNNLMPDGLLDELTIELMFQ